MRIIAGIDQVARVAPERLAYTHRDERLTYGTLARASDALARHLARALAADGSPVVVHGHKQAAMLVAFLGVVKSGHPYVPIDSSWPDDRIAGVIEESRTHLVIAVEPLAAAGQVRVLDGSGLAEETGLAGAAAPERPGFDTDAQPGPYTPQPRPVSGTDPYYVIYTSGSTGRPKGVQISADALERFTDWALTLTGDERVPEPARTDAVWLNQAPYSFDLSVMDLYGALASGATLHAVDKQQIARPADLYADLATSGVSVWVSTPSFADLCLADPSFDAALLPRLSVFLFCGETLTPTTVRGLRARFPGVAVYNTYGPTESTVAVTSVLVDDHVLSQPGPLPVGTPKPGTSILIRDADGHDLPPSTAGEIVIAGDTVSLGYLHRPDLTERAFTTVEIDGRPTPAYKTGDLGRLDETGTLHFQGRVDNQVKLHGYRIECEDIENNLRRLDGLVHAAVLPVRDAEGTVTHLRAYLQLTEPPTTSPLAFATALKKRLKELVPDYMVPKVLTVVDAFPLTANGKADRRRLAEEHP